MLKFPEYLFFTQSQTEAASVPEEPDAIQRNNVLTSCGPVLESYNFPETVTVRCSKASCKLQCPDGQAASPKFIKCHPKKKKFSPKPFSKVRKCETNR